MQHSARVIIRSDLRQKFSGVTTTVFGGGGYLGSDIVNGFARVGSQVIVPYRGDGMHLRHLKVAGDLGQVLTVPTCDMHSVESIAALISKSTVVVNLLDQGNVPVRLNRHRGKYDLFKQTSVDFAHNIATACREVGVRRLIHVSDLAQGADHPYEPLRYKHAGEHAVMQAFPDATILRPGPVFGPNDRFITYMAQWFTDHAPFFPLLNPEQEIQPMFLEDMSRAVMASLQSDEAMGRTFELGGPETYLLSDLFKLVCVRMYEDPFHNKMIRLPNNMLTVQLLHYAIGALRWGTLGAWGLPDHFLARQLRDISCKHNSVDVLGRPVRRFADLNITPVALSTQLQSLLVAFRPVSVMKSLPYQNSPDNVYQYFRDMENVVRKKHE